MAVSSDYRDYVLEQLALLGSVTARRMFGGIGLYADGIFFALIDDDVLYFKADDGNRGDYLARGCEPFRPPARDPNAYSMNYYQVPAEVLEDQDELNAWARKSLAAALRKPRPAARKKARTRKRKA